MRVPMRPRSRLFCSCRPFSGSPGPPPAAMRPQLRVAPIELHRHLDGALRVQTILELGTKHGIALPASTADSLRPHVQITEPQPSLAGFLGRFAYNARVLADLDAVRRVAMEAAEDCHSEGLVYAELRFSPAFMASEHGLDLGDLVGAVVGGVRAAEARLPVRINLIGSLTRQYGVQACHRELDALLTHAGQRGIVALDIAGDEPAVPCRAFLPHVEKARAKGLRITVHAGEACGASEVRDAVEVLGAERIGHGIRAAEDVRVMELLRDRRVGLEVCPTSNLHTGAVRSLAEHPIRRLADFGIPLCLNTDDPGVSGIDIWHEVEAARTCGMDDGRIQRAFEDAWGMAFLDRGERKALMSGSLPTGGR
ncbi:adenosine deaminase [Hyaloraphidium curvatum]|nr:adenosine deaminase [Hyaloraphidium curvatum]